MAGISIESAGTRVVFTEPTLGSRVEVEAAGHELELRTPSRGVWSLGASRAGLVGASSLICDELSLAPNHTPTSHRIHAGLVAALRAAAGGRAAADVEAQVAGIRSTPLVLCERALNAPYLWADARRFRACRVAIASLEADDDDDATPERADALVEMLCSWRNLYARSGAAGRAVNKTLEEFADRMPAFTLWGLRNAPLQRRVQSLQHAELLGALGAHPNAVLMGGHMRLALDASVAEIDAACALTVPALLGLPAQMRPIEALPELLAVCDVDPEVPLSVFRFPDLVQLALHRFLATAPPSTPTRRPPVPLPSIPGVRFLENYGEIIKEGLQMQHCVGSRRFDAARGDAFVFHADGPAGPATVQLNAAGRVVEARGPGNVHNDTATTAARALALWGHGFWVAAWAQERPLSMALRSTVVLPPGVEPLLCVGHCVEEYQRAAQAAEDGGANLARFYETHVAAAVAGRALLVRDLQARPGMPRVWVLDAQGRRIADTRGIDVAPPAHAALPGAAGA